MSAAKSIPPTGPDLVRLKMELAGSFQRIRCFTERVLTTWVGRCRFVNVCKDFSG